MIQVLGTNGSGKSTLLKELATGPGAKVFYGRGGAYTSCPEAKTVLVGNYLGDAVKTPGVDRLSPKTKILAALDEALSAWPGYTVAWEGIIIATRQYHPEYLQRGLRPFYIVLDTPLEVCFDWIEKRSGKPRDTLKQDGKNVSGRQKSIVALVKWLEAQPESTVLHHNPQEGSVWPRVQQVLASGG